MCRLEIRKARCRVCSNIIMHDDGHGAGGTSRRLPPPESSHGSVTPTPNKLLPTGDISHSLAGVELSSTNSLPDTTVSN